MRPFCGVDIKNVRKKEYCEKARPGGWGKCEIKIMGLVYFPYHTCKAVT